MPTRLRFVLPAASALLVLILALTIVLGKPSKGTSSGSGTSTAIRESGRFDGAAFPAGVRAHDFTLEDQRGRSVSLGAYRGQVVALAFVSTDCRSCVLTAQQVRGALDELADAPTYGRGTAVPAMQVMFVSTDPHTDTRIRVRRFLAETSLTRRVSYLTGTETQLRPVWRAYRILPRGSGKKASEAATTVLLIGRAGAERDGFGLEQLTPEGLAHDIRLLRDGRATAG